MKQELVRTKSKISSLKREMSSIQQLHLAQQQVHGQLSAPTIVSPRSDSHHHHHHLHPNDQSNHFYFQYQIMMNYHYHLLRLLYSIHHHRLKHHH